MAAKISDIETGDWGEYKRLVVAELNARFEAEKELTKRVVECEKQLSILMGRVAAAGLVLPAIVTALINYMVHK